MNAALERLVWQRAKSRCEYCQLPQAFSPLPHAIDHIIARQHHGPTQAENLALACFFCNSYKGPNISGLNPQTGRRCDYSTRGRIDGTAIFYGVARCLVGRTHTGVVTIDLLEINRFEAVEFRVSDPRRIISAGDSFASLSPSKKTIPPFTFIHAAGNGQIVIRTRGDRAAVRQSSPTWATTPPSPWHGQYAGCAYVLGQRASEAWRWQGAGRRRQAAQNR